MQTLLRLVLAVLFIGNLIGRSYVMSAEFNPREFGAVGDGIKFDTAAIQQAIDKAAEQKGTVVLDRGVFLTGTLHLKSNVTLKIDPGATLLGSASMADYQRSRRWLAILQASDAKEITITGGGVIDGQGDKLAADVERLMRAGKLDDSPDLRRPGEGNRPQLIELLNCDHVTVRDITLKNAACWVQTYERCDHLLLERVTVRSTTYWNNDGFDIVDCHHVVIRDCDVDSADDGICLKSNKKRGCIDVLVENCKVRSSASAFKIGTASRGAFKKIFVRGLRIHDTFRSAIAIESVDGGNIEDLEFSDIQAKNTGNAFFIRLGKRNYKDPPGTIKNVRIHDLHVEIPATAPDAGYPYPGPTVKAPHNIFPSSIVGIPGHPVSGIFLQNVTISAPGGGSRDIAEVRLENINQIPEKAEKYPEFSMFGELPAWGLYVRHAKEIKIEKSVLQATKADLRSAIVLDDVNSFVLDSVTIKPSGDAPVIATHNVHDLQFQSTEPPAGTQEWVRIIAPISKQ